MQLNMKEFKGFSVDPSRILYIHWINFSKHIHIQYNTIVKSNNNNNNILIIIIII